MAQRVPHCLEGSPAEIGLPVKIPATRGRTERPREASLQPGIGARPVLRRIGGSLGSPRSGGGGGAGEIPPWAGWAPNLAA